MSSAGCTQNDRACQCSPAGQGAVAGGCFLTACGASDLSVFSSAYAAACAAEAQTQAQAQATVANSQAGLQTSVDIGSIMSAATNDLPGTSGLLGLGGAQSTSSSTASGSSSSSKTSAGETMGSTTPSSTGAAQEQSTEEASIAAGGPKLNSATIIGVAVAGAALGLLGGVAIYFFAVVRRKREDRRQWERMEREKAAMQSSLDELQQAVGRSGTFGTMSSMESGRSGSGSLGRKDSLVVNWKEGPQELSVPQRTYHELQGSDTRWEKM